MKSILKAPRTKRLKLQCDELLSSFGLNINLRRYTLAKPVQRISLLQIMGFWYGHTAFARHV